MDSVRTTVDSTNQTSTPVIGELSMITAGHTWCPRQDSNLRSRLRRPVNPRSCASWVSSCSVFPGDSLMCCRGGPKFIARTLARRLSITPKTGNPASGLHRSAIPEVGDLKGIDHEVGERASMHAAGVRPRRRRIRIGFLVILYSRRCSSTATSASADERPSILRMGIGKRAWSSTRSIRELDQGRRDYLADGGSGGPIIPILVPCGGR